MTTQATHTGTVAALEQFAADLEKALAVPTAATDAETRGYDNATRDTLTRVRQILSTPPTPADDTTVDRAAEALCGQSWWAIVPDWVKDQYRDQVRTVITALTGPVP